MGWDNDKSGGYVPPPLPGGFWVIVAAIGAVFAGLLAFGPR